MTQALLHRPYSFAERHVTLQDGVFFVPPRLEHYPSMDLALPEGKISLEYCSGNGEWISSRALEGGFWIALEMRFDRVQKIWKRRRDNLLIICGEAYLTTRCYLREASIDEMFINFPDPWPKRRHAKNRLIQRCFLEEIHRVLKPEGTISFVSDDAGYIEQTKKEFAAHGGFVAVEWSGEGHGPSFFERLWKEKGKEIIYLKYVRCSV